MPFFLPPRSGLDAAKPTLHSDERAMYFATDTGKRYSWNGAVWVEAVLNPGSLGTGTSTGSTFLRDDGIWAAPTGGSGGGGPTMVIKPSSQTHVATAGVSFCNGLSFAITSGVTYYYEFRVRFSSSATTTGLRLGLSYGAVNYSNAWVKIPIAAPGTAGELVGGISASGNSVTGTGVAVINVPYLASIDGIINPSSTTTLNLMFGSEIAATTVSTLTGSIGRLFTIS